MLAFSYIKILYSHVLLCYFQERNSTAMEVDTRESSRMMSTMDMVNTKKERDLYFTLAV